jgi:hypothetical protein
VLFSVTRLAEQVGVLGVVLATLAARNNVIELQRHAVSLHPALVAPGIDEQERLLDALPTGLAHLLLEGLGARRATGLATLRLG